MVGTREALPLRILLLGATGQLGSALSFLLSKWCIVDAPPRHLLDLRHVNAFKERLELFAPDVVINATAWTDVAGAESDPSAAFELNATFVENLACAMVLHNRTLPHERAISCIHFSTDYVFSGDHDRPVDELDPCHPLNAYGRSKLAGETQLMNHFPELPALVLRTSWLHGGLRSFVGRVMSAIGHVERLDMASDIFGTPTFVGHLAWGVSRILSAAQCHPRGRVAVFRENGGIFHAASQGWTSPAGWARAIIESAATLPSFQRQPMPLPFVNPISARGNRTRSSAAMHTHVKRPPFSALCSDRLSNGWGIALPHWRSGILPSVMHVQSKLQSTSA